MKTILIAAVLILAALAIAQFMLSSQFSSRIADLGRRLIATQHSIGPDQASIPPVIRDFALRNGGQVGGPIVVSMIQAAEMRLSVDQPFFSLAASQLSGTRIPGFAWQAKGMMSGFILLQVFDSYVDGEGALEVRIAGSIPVAGSRGPETDKGEAMRYLAELPWNPDAMLNAARLTWRVIDALSVEVAMDTTGGVARVILGLDEGGDIVAIEAADRPRGDGTSARWVGRFSDYAQIGAYRFPQYGEIAWDLPAGEFIYWRGTILSVTAATP